MSTIIINQVINDILKPCTLSEINLTKDTILGIDAATERTGLCLLDIESKKPVYSISISVDKKVDRKNIRYKIALKALIYRILHTYSNVKYIAYEKPFMRTFQVAISLLPLSQMVDELLIEHEPELNYIDYRQLENKTWKKHLLGKLPQSNSALEKQLIADHIETLFPCYQTLFQDEKDACGIALVMHKLIQGEISIEEKKKVHAFKYDFSFIQANNLGDCQEQLRTLAIPEKVIANGILNTSATKSTNLEKKLYKTMTSDDKVVIIEIKAKSAGSFMVEYGIQELQTDYLYFVGWRKNRKK